MNLFQQHITPSPSLTKEGEVALTIFHAAIAAVHPSKLMPQYLSATDTHIHILNQQIEKKQINQLIVIAAGKAASAMAQSAEAQLGNSITKGICITKYHHALPLNHIKTIEAAHPVPDENSLLAGHEVMSLVKNLNANDIVIVLLSGGASSLLADVPDGCTLIEVQLTFDLLLKSGASIHEMNAVRKHLSSIKGGQLAKLAHPAKVFTLLLSDVVGDDLSTIGSGPTVPDHSSFEEVQQILLKYEVWNQIPAAVQQHIQKGLNKETAETPKQDDDVFKQTASAIIGNNHLALQAAAAKATALGYHAIIESSNLQEDAASFAKRIIQQYSNYNEATPACILFGGETTVKVNGTGKGGRNQHLALAALHELVQQKKLQHRITLLSAGTDGTDGNTEVAGAVISSTDTVDATVIQSHLQQFDSYHYFKQHGGQIHTGATQTNVMDIVILLIDSAAP